MWHSQLEVAFMTWLAALTGRSLVFDRLAAALADNDLLKAVPYVVVLVAFWYGATDRRLAARRDVLWALAAGGLAVLVSRIVQDFFQSPRPLWDPALAGLYPDDFRRLVEPDAHSFPSDHVALLAGLTGGVYRLDRRLGIAGILWLGCLAGVRVYLGLHYPVDVLGGAALALAAMWLVAGPLGRRLEAAARAADGATARWPGAAGAALFVVAFQYATLFQASRNLAGRLARLVTMLR